MPPLDPDAPLRHERTKQVSVWVPEPLSQRLDDLCALLNRDGSKGRIHRKDLAAALLLSAPETLSDLEALIQEFRDAKVRHAMVGEEKDAAVIELRPVKPGPRALPS